MLFRFNSIVRELGTELRQEDPADRFGGPTIWSIESLTSSCSSSACVSRMAITSSRRSHKSSKNWSSYLQFCWISGRTTSCWHQVCIVQHAAPSGCSTVQHAAVASCHSWQPNIPAFPGMMTCCVLHKLVKPRLQGVSGHITDTYLPSHA